MASSEPRNIVVVGGGIIGCCTAYFLTRHPSFDASKHTVTILEAQDIASGASGKAGGLLALWAYPKCLVPLSFRLHAELAKQHSGASQWGYRRLHVGQLSAKGRAPAASSNGQAVHPSNQVDRVSLEKRSADANGRLHAAGLPNDLDWFADDCVRGYDAMGDPSDTAQVHPKQFTTAMVGLAVAQGAKIVLGRATAIEQTDGKVTSVSYVPREGPPKQRSLRATDIVLAAGPWTPTVYPPAPIAALRAHSITIKPTRPVSAYAIFTDIALPASKQGGKGERVTPEIYTRPDGEVYACGEGDRLVPLPESTSLVETDPARCQAIWEHISAVSDELRDGELLVRQACYLPQVEAAASQGPLIGKTPIPGLFLAAGHTCWGIQNGPGTGQLMAEFVFDGEAKSAKIKDLDPRLVL